jgi:nitroreductase
MSDGTRSRLTRLDPEVDAARTPAYDVAPLFLNRWSPRAMTGEPLAEEQFYPLFEAARWAPSSYNNQHWRFLYATREDDEWETYLGLLADQNRAWASDAAVLVVVASRTTYEHNGEHARTHSFDAGAAWQNLALEGARRGMAVHAMAGFDYEAAHDRLGLPEDVAVEAMVAIGERGDPETLPDPLADREAPSGRKPLDEIVFHGRLDDAADENRNGE